MAVDDELVYQYFGPNLLRAVVKVLFSELNVLRIQAGLAPRTVDDLKQAVKDAYDTTPKIEFGGDGE